jgi:hypothetical protein
MVQSHRVNGEPRQTVVATVGRIEAFKTRSAAAVPPATESSTTLMDTGSNDPYRRH